MARTIKDSGIEWIGKMPSDWKLVQLKQFTSVNNGKEIISECDSSNPDAVPVYGSGGVFKYTNAPLYCGEAVMFGRKGTLGKPIHVSGRFWTVDTMYFLTYSKDLLPRFNYYQLVAFDWYPYITHTALPSVVASQIVSCRFAFPLVSEQRRIADFLDAECAEIDAVLEKTRASVEEYKKLKQAVITQAVTKGIRGDRPMKDSGSIWFGKIPVEWDVKRIKYLFHIKKEIAGAEGHTVLSITQRGVMPKDLSKNEGQLAENYSNYQLVNPGDFAMNHMDLLTGWVDISKYDGVTSPDYRVFVLDDTKNNNRRYYLYMMQMCYFNRIFYGLGAGVSGMGRWRLQADKFLNFIVAVPPAEEQREISEHLDTRCKELDSLIEKKARFLSELEFYKKSLIFEYVTGKKEV
ncbi:MAG: restriction endonuclease subunit S [Oscillospiraceae bacterium]|nr:restriction endonuclease subunit S [Oscillospiraceae bacterium]